MISQRKSSTFGPAYDPAYDGDRLFTQMESIREFMLSTARYWTLKEIEEATGHPASSISAQLRHLRKSRFGSFLMHKQHRGGPGKGLWEYRVYGHHEYVPPAILASVLKQRVTTGEDHELRGVMFRLRQIALGASAALRAEADPTKACLYLDSILQTIDLMET